MVNVLNGEKKWPWTLKMQNIEFDTTVPPGQNVRQNLTSNTHLHPITRPHLKFLMLGFYIHNTRGRVMQNLTLRIFSEKCP